MGTDRAFVDYVAEQAGLGARLTYRRMFGEYGLYIDGKVVAFACDDSLFVKPAAATAALTSALPQRPPYPGAKDYPVADELLDDGDALRALLLATHAALPPPKPPKQAKPPKPESPRVPAKKPAGAKKAAAKKPAAAKEPAAEKKPAPRTPRR